MYHIFLILALNLIQDQVDKTKNFLLQKENQEILVSDKESSRSENLDIIDRLKKENLTKKQSENDIDLESLGLDAIGDEASFQQSITNETKQENKLVSDNKDHDLITKLPLNPVERAPEEQKLSKIVEHEQSNESKPSSKVIKDQIKSETYSDKNSQDSLTKIESLANNQEKQEGIIEKVKKTVKENIDLIKNKDEPKQLIANQNQEITENKDNQAKADSADKSKEISKEKNIKKSNQKKTKVDSKAKSKTKFKIKNRSQKTLAALRKRIAGDEVLSREKAKKLRELRKKYVTDWYFGSNGDYGQLGNIVPRKKIEPRIILEELPYPLLSRVRNDDNKHHPIVITEGEKVDLIFRSIANNKFDDFSALFDSINKPNLRNYFGDSLLTFSVLMQKPSMIKSLLSRGANPDLPNQLGYTPLNIAIEIGDYQSVQILLDGAASIDYVDSLGRTYLMQASRLGSLAIVDLLVERGADVNKTDNNDVTALWMAYKYNQEVVAQFLIKNGALSWLSRDYDENEISIIKQLESRWH